MSPVDLLPVIPADALPEWLTWLILAAIATGCYGLVLLGNHLLAGTGWDER